MTQIARGTTMSTATTAKSDTGKRVTLGKAWARFSSVVYPPALLVPAGALLLVGAGWATGWGGVDFTASLTNLRFVTVGPLAVAMIGLFLVVERVRPAQLRPLVARGHRHDVLFTVLNVVIVLPLVTALTLSLSDVLQRLAPWVVLPRIGVMPSWVSILLILVAMDGCNWFVHLANHRVQVLWRFHELHHSQEDMNVLTVFRTHPLIHVSYVLAVIPALVLLANGELPTLLLVVYGGSVAFAHSNTNLSFGPLERVFVSPNYHRIHHRVRGRQDVNLGFALTIWDQLSHRAVFPTAETIRTETGLPQRPLRVEQQGSRARHLTVLGAQLLGPFRPLNEGEGPILGTGAGVDHSDGGQRAGGTAMLSATVPRRRPAQWLRLLFGTTSGGRAVDLALLAVRVAVAWVFIYYGAAKLFGAFPGAGPHGIHQTGLFMSRTAHLRPGEFFAVLAGVTEFGGGIAMALGLGTRLAGVALFGDMVLAMITVTWATGINSASAPPGYQLNLALAVLALTGALVGAGRFSIDAVLCRALDRQRGVESTKGDPAVIRSA